MERVLNVMPSRYNKRYSTSLITRESQIKTTAKYYSALKKEGNPVYHNLENLEKIMLSEIDQMQEDRYCMISFVCGI